MIKYELDCLEKVINHCWTSEKIKMLADRPSLHTEILTLVTVLHYERAIIAKDDQITKNLENLSSGKYRKCGYSRQLVNNIKCRYNLIKNNKNMCGDIVCPLTLENKEANERRKS